MLCYAMLCYAMLCYAILYFSATIMLSHDYDTALGICMNVTLRAWMGWLGNPKYMVVSVHT